LSAVRALLPPKPAAIDGASPDFPFAGGAVGYFGYELAGQLPPVRAGVGECEGREAGLEALALPDLVLLFVDRLLAIDLSSRRGGAIGLGFAEDLRSARMRAERASCEIDRCAGAAPADSPVRGEDTLPMEADPIGLRATLDAEAYVKAVDAIGCEIEAGNVYQANLTYRMEMPIGRADPWTVYRELRALNPAPFAAFLELPEVAILSSSPERFLALDAEGSVESRPIKGTRPRGRDAAQDSLLQSELSKSQKDRAENLMIVDLVRNDLGRVCRPGTIRVPELMEIERYAAVFQMVSTVQGTLATGKDAFDLIRATFPPGSMTGAPKLASIELLERLETVRRGVYAGALGYLDIRGGLDLSVVIRTFICQDGMAYLHVGGGVVADSSPEGEYLESLDKARAPLAALDAAAAAANRTLDKASSDE